MTVMSAQVIDFWQHEVFTGAKRREPILPEAPCEVINLLPLRIQREVRRRLLAERQDESE